LKGGISTTRKGSASSPQKIFELERSSPITTTLTIGHKLWNAIAALSIVSARKTDSRKVESVHPGSGEGSQRDQ